MQSDDASNIALSTMVGVVPAGLSGGAVETLPDTGLVRVPVSLNIYMRLITVVSNGCSRSPLPISTASKLPLKTTSGANRNLRRPEAAAVLPTEASLVARQLLTLCSPNSTPHTSQQVSPPKP